MKLQLIRNATLKLDYAGRTVLVDPYLAPKHSLPSFTGRSPNPMVELPAGIEDILDGVELVIVSHLHDDHFDSVAMQRVPKHLPLFCQPGDEATIREAGFTNVTPLTGSATWEGLTLTRRDGSHGLGPVVELMGSVMGFSLEAAGEPSIYWAGDTVLYPPVAAVIGDTKPDIIITHSCGARWDGDLIVMDALETVAVCEAAPDAIVIATHMEALDHATITRQDLRHAAMDQGIAPSRLVIPADGETVILGSP
ncbi:MBL fold metallo-hydrolase [Rhizobium sp. Root1204]|uniref:MBL fold metallo-hydrolase n=1 Tax=Rhizobium sp. Root1204 TaxID=1736428 RepID=UPI00071603E5|nr:MBL fold metallo-hydrolase [Rhizobium sp. Root1204]KQV37692.1 Zn-dependent hydrolase [Rhizobium sp. Root1204]